MGICSLTSSCWDDGNINNNDINNKINNDNDNNKKDIKNKNNNTNNNKQDNKNSSNEPKWLFREGRINNVLLRWVEYGGSNGSSDNDNDNSAGSSRRRSSSSSLRRKRRKKRPLIILLHGMIPSCWYIWRYQIPILHNHGYYVIALDIRGGCNLSEKSSSLDGGSGSGSSSLDMNTLTKDIYELMKYLKYKSIYAIIGHSLYGGIIAWSFASRYSKYLHKLIVLNSPHPLQLRNVLQLQNTSSKSQNKLKKWCDWNYSSNFSLSIVSSFWYLYFFQLQSIPELLLLRQTPVVVNHKDKGAIKKEGHEEKDTGNKKISQTSTGTTTTTTSTTTTTTATTTTTNTTSNSISSSISTTATATAGCMLTNCIIPHYPTTKEKNDHVDPTDTDSDDNNNTNFAIQLYYDNIIKQPNALYSMIEYYRCLVQQSFEQCESYGSSVTGGNCTIITPTLILWGIQDELFCNTGNGSLLFHDIDQYVQSNQLTISLLDCGHYISEELPNDVNSQIIQFLSK